MEKLSSSNQSFSDNNNPDITEKLSGFLVQAVQPIIGLAVVATNIALLYFYKHGEKASKITLLFLTNLTASDILFGSLFPIRFVLILAAPEFVTEACRFALIPGSIISVMVSAWSILLITIQVGNKLYH